MGVDVVTIAQQGAAGEGLGTHTASQTTTHLTICTSGTRPSSPFEGQLIYETDTNLFKFWDGALWKDLVPATPAATNALICLVERRTTAQPIASGVRSTILFNQIHQDNENIFNNVTGEFTLVTGKYGVDLSVAYQSLVVNPGAWVEVVSGTVLPGSAVAGVYHHGGGSGGGGASEAAVLGCSGGFRVTSATAKFRARTSHEDGASRDISGYSYASPLPDAAVTSLTIYRYA